MLERYKKMKNKRKKEVNLVFHKHQTQRKNKRKKNMV